MDTSLIGEYSDARDLSHALTAAIAEFEQAHNAASEYQRERAISRVQTVAQARARVASRDVVDMHDIRPLIASCTAHGMNRAATRALIDDLLRARRR